MQFLLICLLFAATDHPVVDNGLTPKKPQTLVFEEDLRFGGLTENYRWTNPNTNIAVAKDGTIYVADTRAVRVLAFNPQGQFLRQIIGEGKEPGQLNCLDNIAVLADGTLAILAAQSGTPARLHFFDSNGNYLREHVPPKDTIVRSCLFDPGGTYLAGSWISPASPTMTSTKTGLLNLNMEPLRTDLESVVEFDPTRINEADNFLPMMIRLLEAAYAPKLRLAYDSQGRLFSARSDQYRITRSNTDMTRTHWVARKKFKPIANDNAHIANTALPLIELFKDFPALDPLITPAFLDKLLSTAKLPANKPPLFGLIPTGDGGVLAIHNFDLESGTQSADIFDAQGQFTGSVTMPNQAFINGTEEPNMLFANGFAYTVEIDKNRQNTVVRYRYRKQSVN